MVQASSRPGDVVLDFFAGSGTTGVAALELGRRFILMDNNAEALEVMARRFDRVDGIEWIGLDPTPYQSGRRQPSLLRLPHRNATGPAEQASPLDLRDLDPRI